MWSYKIVKTSEGMFFFHARGKPGLFSGILSNYKGWHERYFFISAERWEYPPDEENLVQVQRSWGVPLSRGNVFNINALVRGIWKSCMMSIGFYAA